MSDFLDPCVSSGAIDENVFHLRGWFFLGGGGQSDIWRRSVALGNWVTHPQKLSAREQVIKQVLVT